MTGDHVLAKVGEAAQAAIRSGDMVARVGGEEFGMVLWGASIEDATRTCERVRTAVEDMVIALGPEADVRVTASFGVAEIRSDSMAESHYAAADRALYAAKLAGRNRLHVAN